jgi:hypothetical protein
MPWLIAFMVFEVGRSLASMRQDYMSFVEYINYRIFTVVRNIEAEFNGADPAWSTRIGSAARRGRL